MLTPSPRLTSTCFSENSIFVEERCVVGQVVTQYTLGRCLELLPQRRVGIGCVQVRMDEARHFRSVGNVTADGASVHLGERIVQRLAIAQRFRAAGR